MYLPALVLLVAAGINPNHEAGSKGCQAPAVSIETQTPVVIGPGETARYSADVSGGSDPYHYAWDIDANAATDWDGAVLETRFPGPFDGQLSLTVTDSTGCSATTTIAQQVVAPSVVFEQVEEVVELCGDGDGELEPGERGRARVALSNPSVTDADDVYAVFTPVTAPVRGKITGGPDRFGYTFADSAEPACRYEFVGIENTGQALTYQGLSVGDESFAVVTAAGNGITVYGSTHQTLSMSSNGYLALDASDNGQDLRPACPLPQDPTIGPNNGRLLVYHDDLIERSSGGAYYQYFELCPRAGDVGNTGACHIFQWHRYDFGTGGPTGPGPRPESDFDFQAIVYEGSGQVVYQYRGSNPTNGGGAAVGILGPNADDAIQYSCRQQIVTTDKAVCFFAPEVSEPAPFASAGLQLESPALALGDLAAGQSASVDITFRLEPDFDCGARVGFDYLGATYAGGFSATSASEAVALATSDQCDNSQVCAVPEAQVIAPEPGLLFDPLRPGNGVDMQVVGSNLALLWYTAQTTHYPHWYFVAGPYANNQVVTDILDFRLTGSFGPGDPSFTTAGRAFLTWIAADEMIYIWDLDGRRWGERMQILRTSNDGTNLDNTAQYYNAEESGWGIAINQQGAVEVQTGYFYDDQGRPVWLLSQVTDASGTSSLDGFQWVHCPGCPWVAPVAVAAGSSQRQLNGDGTGVLTTEIQLPPPMSGSWNRQALPIIKIN